MPEQNKKTISYNGLRRIALGDLIHIAPLFLCALENNYEIDVFFDEIAILDGKTLVILLAFKLANNI